MMKAGMLNKRITFMRNDGSQDTSGQRRPDWVDVCTVWASIRPATGKQLALAQTSTVTSTATHSILIRYNDQVRGQVNFKIRYAPDGYDPRYYRINSILDSDEGHFELRLMVTEVAK